MPCNLAATSRHSNGRGWRPARDKFTNRRPRAQDACNTTEDTQQPGAPPCSPNCRLFSLHITFSPHQAPVPVQGCSPRPERGCCRSEVKVHGVIENARAPCLQGSHNKHWRSGATFTRCTCMASTETSPQQPVVMVVMVVVWLAHGNCSP